MFRIRSAFVRTFFVVAALFISGWTGTALGQATDFTVQKYICPVGVTLPQDVTTACAKSSTLSPTYDDLYPDGVPPGTSMSYAVEIVNIGAISSFTIEDAFPSGFNPAGVACYTSNPNTGSSTATNFSALPATVVIPAGQTMYCVFSGNFDGTATTADNTVTVKDVHDHVSTDDIAIDIDTSPVLPVDLSITKTVDPAPIDVSGGPVTVTYDVTITNDGGPNGNVDVFLGDFLEVTDKINLLASSAPFQVTLLSFSCANSSAGSSDCLSPPSSLNSTITVGSINPAPLFTASFPSNSPGLLEAGQTITLTYELEVSSLLDCYITPNSDGLENEVFFNLTKTPGITMSEGDPLNPVATLANNTATSQLDINTGASLQNPDCQDPGDIIVPNYITVDKELINPTMGYLGWNGPAAKFRITIKNTGPDPINDIRVRDNLQQMGGTPMFDAIFYPASWSCNITSGTGACGGLVPSGTQSFDYYGDQEWIWQPDYNSLLSLDSGGVAVIEFKISFDEKSCDSLDAARPNWIKNIVRVSYEQLVEVTSGNFQTFTLTQSSSASVGMKSGEQCNFEVTKTVDSSNTKVIFGQTITYKVRFANNDSVSRQVGSVFDAIRITQSGYATSLPFSYSYTCTPSSATAVTPSGGFIGAGTNASAVYTVLPSQGARTIDLGPLQFAPSSTLDCKVKVTVSQPSANTPCMAVGERRLENLGLMDVSTVYNNNLPWPPSGTYSAPSTMQPSPQNENWATVSLDLPKCYNLELNKDVDFPYTWPAPDGPDLTFSVGVKNIGTTPITGFEDNGDWTGPIVSDYAVSGTPGQPVFDPLGVTVTPPCSYGSPDCEWLLTSPPGSAPNPPVPFDIGIVGLAAGDLITMQYTVLNNFEPGNQICNTAEVALKVPNISDDWYTPNSTPQTDYACVLVLPTGTLAFTKVVINKTFGTIPPMEPPQGFEISYTCNPLAPNQPIDGSVFLSSPAISSYWSGGGEFTIPILGSSQSCTVSESLPSLDDLEVKEFCRENQVLQWADPVYDPSQPVDVFPGETTEVKIINALNCVPKRSELTINKFFDNSNGNMPNLGGASFDFAINGCSATPSSITLTDIISSATVDVNVGETCTVTETSQTLVDPLPPTCSWQTFYDPQLGVTVSENGINRIDVHNRVDCIDDPLPFSTEHFQCYFVKQETPFEPVRSPNVVLDDQFGRTENRVMEPRLICAPVEKDGEGLENKRDHLVFYELEEKIPVNKLVEVENQFGKQRLRVLDSFLLGVPSLKTVIEEKPPILEIDKEAVSSPCIVGQLCGFIVTISNSGAPFTGNLQVTDTTTPAGLNLQSVSPPPPPSSCVLPGSTPITCSTGPVTITQGNPLSFTATLLVPDPMSQNWIENCVKLFDGAGNLIDTSCAKVEVIDHKGEERVDLGVRKSLLNGPLQNGDTAQFEITVTNYGNPIIQPFQITVPDIMPTGFAFVGNTGLWNCGPVGVQSITCVWTGTGTILSGPLPPFVIEADISGSKGGRQCARVEINGYADINPGNNESCIIVPVDPRTGKVDLGIRKSLLNGPLQNGDTAQFKITVTNYGNPIIQPFQITVPDIMPTGFAFVGNTGLWNCGPVGAQSITCDWTGTGTILSGTMPSFVIEADISGSKGGRQCARVEINGYTDINPGNNESCIIVPVDPRTGKVDLGVSKELLNGPLQNGDTAQFKITVTNYGNPIIQPFQITVPDIMPTGFAFVGNTGPWNCGPAGAQSITCDWTGAGTILSGPLPPFVIEADISGGKGGRQCASVEINGYTDINPDNDMSCVDVVINPKSTGGGQTPSLPFACVTGLRSANSNLNMRYEPSGNSRILQKLGQETPLIILRRQGEWSQVEVANGDARGRKGWVATRFLRGVSQLDQCLRSVQQEVNEPTRQIIPNQPANGINPGNDLTNKIIGIILPNGSVAPTGEGSFACVDYLPKNDPVLILRSEPSGKARALQELPGGTALMILKPQEKWTQVEVATGDARGRKGWVATRFLRKAQNPQTCMPNR